MAQTNINIRIDEALKREFDAVCNDLGLTMTTAVNVFAKTVIRRRAIPFEITTEEDSFFSEANQKRLLRAISDYEDGRNFHEHELIEVD
jgi:DNA-damage-inducible protein J